MHDVERGVRELVRSVLRDKGIKHRSDDFNVSTVCYAQHPLHSIEYFGPIRFYYNNGAVTANVYGLTKTKLIKANTNGVLENNYQVLKIDEQTFEIANPNFHMALGELLDKYIQDKNKRPSPYKKLIASSNVAFVPDATTKPKLSFWSKLRRWFLGQSFGDDFLWLQAVQRHFRISEKEAAEILQTVEALRESDSYRGLIIDDTRHILE